MGEPVKIDDLAREMVRLSGHEADVDIAIVYTGLRPGEKLFEELLGASEGAEPTEHQKIFKAKTQREWPEHVLWESVAQLQQLSEASGARDDLIDVMKTIVPTYKPDMRTGSILNW
jgi:FlaA1/EpsC-like NDP-sugar epimerase